MPTSAGPSGADELSEMTTNCQIFVRNMITGRDAESQTTPISLVQTKGLYKTQDRTDGFQSF